MVTCKMMADLALEFGVSVFVYSSQERGGEADDDGPNNFKPSTIAKIHVERHVKALGEKGLPWT